MRPEELAALAGQEIGVSDWLLVDQAMIDAFADVTRDRQFIHIDPDRAARTPFGGTIAHGFLTLSLLSHMLEPFMPVLDGAQMSVNYGFDRIRFLSPVPVGSHVRARFALAGTQHRGRDVQNRYAVEVEIKGATRPALIADWITLAVLQPS
jgi:acyl dehydratase